MTGLDFELRIGEGGFGEPLWVREKSVREDLES